MPQRAILTFPGPGLMFIVEILLLTSLPKPKSLSFRQITQSSPHQKLLKIAAKIEEHVRWNDAHTSSDIQEIRSFVQRQVQQRRRQKIKMLLILNPMLGIKKSN